MPKQFWLRGFEEDIPWTFETVGVALSRYPFKWIFYSEVLGRFKQWPMCFRRDPLYITKTTWPCATISADPGRRKGERVREEEVLHCYYYTILYTIYYILYTIYYILYTIYYILYYYILYTIYYMLYTIYYILYYYPPTPGSIVSADPGRRKRERARE